MVMSAPRNRAAGTDNIIDHWSWVFQTSTRAREPFKRGKKLHFLGEEKIWSFWSFSPNLRLIIFGSTAVFFPICQKKLISSFILIVMCLVFKWAIFIYTQDVLLRLLCIRNHPHDVSSEVVWGSYHFNQQTILQVHKSYYPIKGAKLTGK